MKTVLALFLWKFCWHFYGIFRNCLQLKFLEKLLFVSGSHSELKCELWQDAQCWSLRGTPGVESSETLATQGILKSNYEGWTELMNLYA